MCVYVCVYMCVGAYVCVCVGACVYMIARNINKLYTYRWYYHVYRDSRTHPGNYSYI